MDQRTACIATREAGKIAIVWAAALPLALVAIHCVIWHASLHDLNVALLTPLPVFGLVIAGLMAHELLHAVGYLGGGASRKSISFHFQAKTLTAYVKCPEFIPARHLKLTCLLPLLVLGLAPLPFTLGAGSLAGTIWSALMISACAGDVAVFLAIKDVPGNCPARIHRSETGCVYLYDDTPG